MAKEEIREKISVVVDDLFEKLPREKLDKMIAELVPQIIVSTISDQLKDVIQNYYYGAMGTMNQIAEEKIQNILNPCLTVRKKITWGICLRLPAK